MTWYFLSNAAEIHRWAKADRLHWNNVGRVALCVTFCGPCWHPDMLYTMVTNLSKWRRWPVCRNTILETGSGRHTKSHCIYSNSNLHKCLNNINMEKLRIFHIAKKFCRKDKDLTPWEPRFRSRMPATDNYQNKFGRHYVYPIMCKFQYMAGYAGFNKHAFSLYFLPVSSVSNNDLFIDTIVQNGRHWRVVN